MIAGCGTCGAEMEHLGTFETTIHRKEKVFDIVLPADVFRCRNCLRIVIWE
ncbi:MAG TPA: hypothetical protein VEP90_22905 [Methylomirabilota bacterium]|nr:hypothetical protein [Methylomirabilota bacterium]